MVTTSASHCLRYPEGTHVEVVSLTMLKTVITTLQGASALYILIGIMSPDALPGGAIRFGVDTLFFPLAILGLLRLCAAAWLTEDFVYQRDSMRIISTIETATQFTTDDNDMELNDTSRALDPLIATRLGTSSFGSPAHSWGSRLFRMLFLLLLGSVYTIVPLIAIPFWGNTWYTATTFLLSVFYLLSFTVTLILYTFYFFRGQTTTTILPCISSMWYRLYTLLLMDLMLALIVIASIETNRTPTGIYTSQELAVKAACADSIGSQWWLPLPLSDRWMGLVTDKKLEENWNQTSLLVKSLQEAELQEEFWLYNFTGMCIGNFKDI